MTQQAIRWSNRKRLTCHSIVVCLMDLLTGHSEVAVGADAATGCEGEQGYTIVPAGGAAARVKLLHVLLPCPFEVRHPDASLNRCRAETYQLIDGQNLQSIQSITILHYTIRHTITLIYSTPPQAFIPYTTSLTLLHRINPSVRLLYYTTQYSILTYHTILVRTVKCFMIQSCTIFCSQLP